MKNSEESPNSLSRPDPGAKRMAGVIIAIFAAIVGMLLTVLTYSIFNSAPEQKDRAQQQKEQPVVDKKPLTADTPDSNGLALAPAPKPKEQEPGGKNADAGVKRQPALTPEQMAIMQERAQIRKMRMQREMEALQAPLAISVNNGGTSRSSIVKVAASPASAQNHDSEASRSSASPTQYDNAERKDKENFLSSRSVQTDAWRLGNTRQPGVPCEIKTGTVIPGIMLTGVNSDLPGKIIGQVSQNVYDTATGRFLLIPQGSRLFGVYDSRIAVGQNRLLIAWNRIIFPDGSSVDIEAMPGTDQGGAGGLEDSVDNHYLRIFGSAIIMSMITGGMSYSVDAFRNNSNSGNNNTTNNNPSLRDEMGTALAAQLGQASLQLLQQNVNIKPTLEVRPGFRFNIVLVKDMAFDSPYAPLN